MSGNLGAAAPVVRGVGLGGFGGSRTSAPEEAEKTWPDSTPGAAAGSSCATIVRSPDCSSPVALLRSSVHSLLHAFQQNRAKTARITDWDVNAQLEWSLLRRLPSMAVIASCRYPF